jgi:hypothetical protein
MDHFFGYGSLVNRETHDFPDAAPARLRGWRRLWLAVPEHPVAFLSVEPAADVTIDGLVARVPGGDWRALDRREAGYDRVAIAGDALAPADRAAQLYTVRNPRAAIGAAPILISYLDTVVQGFLREFGPEGAARFFATTVGWQAPLIDDRAAPRYPRATVLEPAERAIIDAHLARAVAA